MGTPVGDPEYVKAMLSRKNGGTSSFPGAHPQRGRFAVGMVVALLLRFHSSELFDSQRATGTRGRVRPAPRCTHLATVLRDHRYRRGNNAPGSIVANQHGRVGIEKRPTDVSGSALGQLGKRSRHDRKPTPNHCGDHCACFGDWITGPSHHCRGWLHYCT